MIEIKEVKTKRQQKEFLEFPLKLYKGCPYYSPNLYMDEKKLFKSDYFYYKTCEAIYFNAYRDGKMVGRIGGILQKAANEKWNQKRVRFTRLDLIDDLEVCQALLFSVENWARNKGMDTVFGPMGFSDMEKEGLLVEGFEEPTTLSENYNYPYYKDLLEKCGYSKEATWIAHQARMNPDEDIEKVKNTVSLLLKKYDLKYVDVKNTNRLLKEYGQQFFDIAEESYSGLYQTVPFLKEQVDDMIKSFKLVLSYKYISMVVDKNDKVVAFAIMMPYIADILNKTGGKIKPWILPKLLKKIKHPDVYEFCLIGVRDNYRNSGIALAPVAVVYDLIRENHIEFCETNLTLEDNLNIINLLTSRFVLRDHRLVQTFLKTL